MDIDKKQILVQCYHCGNKTLMDIKYELKERFGGVTVNENCEPEFEMQEDYFWLLLSCPVCHFPTLFQKYTDESMQTMRNGEITQLYESQVIYPNNKMQMNDVPKEVVAAFESALKIKNIDSQICLISLRRTLELICKDKEAKGRNLKARITNLINKNIFPKDLENAFDVIREYGNDGAHSNISLTMSQLNELINILYSVINYLYIVPNKSLRMKEKLDEMREELVVNE